MERKFRLVPDKDNIRIDMYLAEALSLTRAKVQGLIAGGHVRILNKVPKSSLRVKRGMEIEGELVTEEPASLSPENIPLTILYEDEYLLAIDKPVGMVVHPSCGHRSGTLVNAVLSHLERPASPSSQGGPKGPNSTDTDERPGIVHRLDKDTTGVILVAKDPKTQEALSSQFHDRNVEKIYRAVVEGAVKEDEGVIEGPMGRHPTMRKKMAIVAKGGRYSITRFKVIRRLEGFTYLEAYPKTGRTHQIRVHFAAIGHPIVGDELYGKKARRLTSRPLLHAYKILIGHPVRKLPLQVEAPVPQDFKEFIDAHAV
ncbi:MAG: RluA family pseudouridine synthase [Syntrophorhabdales bacterium]|jgi:23S rRNA pseudouridine1911/1915/1917 synthase